MKQREYNLDRLKRFAAGAGTRQRLGPVAERESAAGLSKLHNRTLAAETLQPLPSRITWYPGASLVEVEVPLPAMPPPGEKKRKPRGKITEWTLSSRARLKRFLGTLKREETGRALVVALTYPAEFPAPDDHEVYKRHLHIFGIYLTRKWPRSSAIWKLEFQQRGAAHYHLMIFGLWGNSLAEIREWMDEAWYRIAHNGDKHLGKRAIRSEWVKTPTGAMNYFAKYIGKTDQTMPGNFSGRYWGKINSKRLPCIEPQSLDLPKKIAFQLRRWARKKIENDVNGSKWRRWLESMEGETPNYVLGSRLGWEHGLAQLRSGKEMLKWWRWNRGGAFNEDGFNFHIEPHLDQWICWKEFLTSRKGSMPKKWRARNNQRVRVLCDASLFIEAIARLDAPASSFLQFSRELLAGG